MDELTPQSAGLQDIIFLKLAREIAMDIRPLEDILASHDLSSEDWTGVEQNPTFRTYLRSAIEEWAAATNTSERVRLKSMAFIEESLPEFFTRAHDPKEALPAKIEVLKTIAKFAGIGNQVDGAIQGERLSVTINLGSDRQLKIERDVTPQGNDIIEG